MTERLHDALVFDTIEREERRQLEGIELIASENFVSPAVLKAQGSVLTNKYAEGYPGRRYYGGCEYIDVIEQAAIDRAKELFGAEYANVQPHSGSSANLAVYRAFLNVGDRVLGMDLSQGGHLTHGSPVNFSGQSYEMHAYGVDPVTELIDYQALEAQAEAVKPKMIIAGASAYSRTIDFERIGQIAKKVGAIYFVDMAHIAGLVAAGLHPNPVPYADVVTTTHKTLRGPRGGLILAKAQYAKQLNMAIFPGIQGGPLEHVVAAKAVALLEALQPSFKTYAAQVIKNAQAMVEVFLESPLRVVSGGTDNHLFNLDVTPLGVTGKEAQERLDQVGITVNKNSIPNDSRSFIDPSGIRIGTSAITTRGMKEAQAQTVARLILKTLTASDDQLATIRQEVKDLVAGLPLYQA